MLETKLKSLSGEKSRLSDLLVHDKLNLLLFYNTNCLGCTGRAIPYIYELSKKYAELNVVIVHVSFGGRVESNAEINAVFTAGSAPFPIYRDDSGELYRSFHCEGTPHWIFCDHLAQVKHSIFGSQQGAKLKIEYALDELVEGSC
jgi:thiol-disulfide isomerase/thioredoxin